MNEKEPTNSRPFRRCLDTWPEGMGVELGAEPMSVPEAWLSTKAGLPYPWNGEFLKWQEEINELGRRSKRCRISERSETTADEAGDHL